MPFPPCVNHLCRGFVVPRTRACWVVRVHGQQATALIHAWYTRSFVCSFVLMLSSSPSCCQISCSCCCSCVVSCSLGRSCKRPSLFAVVFLLLCLHHSAPCGAISCPWCLLQASYLVAGHLKWCRNILRAALYCACGVSWSAPVPTLSPITCPHRMYKSVVTCRFRNRMPIAPQSSSLSKKKVCWISSLRPAGHRMRLSACGFPPW